MHKIAFLDRDGTLNIDFGYVYEWKNFAWIENVKDQLKVLKNKGFKLAIITNQSGIARNLFTLEDVNELHKKLNQDLKKSHDIEIDFFKICEHHPDFTGPCDCRKPNTKLLNDLETEIGQIDKTNSIMIGDKDSDYLCGKNFGIKSYQLKTEKYKSKNDNKKYRSMQEIINLI